MRTIAIIQARVGSARLENKIFATLGKRTIVEWVIQRLKACKLIDGIILATSDNSRDDVVEQFAKLEGIDLIRGSEENVLA